MRNKELKKRLETNGTDHKLEASEGAATVLHPHANALTYCTVYISLMYIYI